MRGGIHQPCAMEFHYGPQEDAPTHQAGRQERAPADRAPCDEDHRKNEERNSVPFLQPTMKGVAPKVGHVWRECGIAHRVASHQPTGMRPPPAVARRVGIAVPVGVLMMDTVGCDPKERAALQCERAADGQDTFEPPRCLVSAMREQAVISDADTPAACDPKQGQCDPKCLPSEKEKRRQRSPIETVRRRRL